MNQGCNATVFEHELAAFALPAGLDRSPPRCIDSPNAESRWMDDSIDALGLTTPVLALDASDVMLLPEPNDYTPASSSYSSSSWRATLRGRSKCSGGASSSIMSPKTHRHHSKKVSRKQVLELQTMVNTMQMQVDSAATQIQHLAQLVGEVAHQHQQEQEYFRRQQLLFEEHVIDMDIGTQQRHLRAQVEQFEREQFEREQRQQYDCP